MIIIIRLLDDNKGIYQSISYRTIMSKNYQNLTNLQSENKQFISLIKKPHVKADEITQQEYEQIK